MVKAESWTGLVTRFLGQGDEVHFTKVVPLFPLPLPLSLLISSTFSHARFRVENNLLRHKMIDSPLEQDNFYFLLIVRLIYKNGVICNNLYSVIKQLFNFDECSFVNGLRVL